MSASSTTSTRGTTVIDDKVLRAIVSEAVENVPGTTHIDLAGMQRYPKVDVSVDPATETVAAKATIACVYPSPVTTVAEACRHAVARAVRTYSGYTCTAVSVVVGTVVREDTPVYLTDVERHPLEPQARPVITAPRSELIPVRTAQRGSLEPIRTAPRQKLSPVHTAPRLQLGDVHVRPRPEVRGVSVAQRADIVDVRVQPRTAPRSVAAPKRRKPVSVSAPTRLSIRTVEVPKRPAVRSVKVGKRARLTPVVKPRRVEPALVSAPKRPALRKPVRRPVRPVYHPMPRSRRKVQR